MATVHIIGAGLAGLTAASTLAREGHYVQVYEASPAAGGRCKLLYDEGDNTGFDGCNALVFGAQSRVMRLAETYGTAHTLQPIGLGGEGFDSKARAMRARLAYLMPPAMPLVDWMDLIGLLSAPSHRTVADVFDYYHPLRERYIEPLCRSLMFATPEDANARVFARRLLYLWRRGMKGMRLMVPKHSLYQTLIAPALQQIEQEGGAVYYGQQVKRLEFRHGRVSGFDMARQKKVLRAEDQVILALPPLALASLLPGMVAAEQVETRDVASVVFELPALQEPMLTPLTRGVADWAKGGDGRLTVTAYAPERVMQQDNQAVARRFWREVAPMLRLPQDDMPKARVVKERKAVLRFKRAVALPQNLVCAGDAFGPQYLPPLEAAIASAEMAAHKIRDRIAR